LSLDKNPWSHFRDLSPKTEEQTDDRPADSTVRERTEKAGSVRRLEDLPVEEVNLKPASRIAYVTEPRSLGADRFRFLRMGLREGWSAGKLRKLLVTSPLPGDGKSTVTLNLGAVLAEHGQRSVLLVEADLYHASLSPQLGLETKPGLTECLEGRLNPLAAVRRLQPMDVYFMSAGRLKSNSTELLQSQALSDVFAQLSPHFDWVVIDSPPVIPVSDALSLRQEADASLLVVRAGSTPSQAVEHALALLGRKHVLGIVFNGVEGLDRLYSKSYKDYYAK